MAKKTRSLDEQLERLENIQKQLEDGSIPLEQMMKLYEEGMALVKDTRELLSQAELRIIEIRAEHEKEEGE